MDPAALHTLSAQLIRTWHRIPASRPALHVTIDNRLAPATSLDDQIAGLVAQAGRSAVGGLA